MNLLRREEEFMAEKWGQKDKKEIKEIHISAPIFLPLRFPPALLLQGHKLNPVASQVDPMEGVQWTMAKERLKLRFIVLGTLRKGREAKCRVIVDQMETLVPQGHTVPSESQHPRHLFLAAKEIGQGFHVEAQLEKTTPILQQIQKSGAKGLATLVGLAPSLRIHSNPLSRLRRQRAVDKSRLDLRWPKIDQFAVVRSLEEQVIEQLGVMVGRKPALGLELIYGRVRDDQIQPVGLGKIAMSGGYGHFPSHGTQADGLQTSGKIVPVNDLVTKPAQFILRLKGVAHVPIVNLRELFLVCRAHADRG